MVNLARHGICPECNKFLYLSAKICRNCYRKRKQNNSQQIECACACGKLIPSLRVDGVEKKYYIGHNDKFQKTGSQSPFWKGGITKHPRGYIKIYKPEHPNSDRDGYIFEHRVIMEQYLGRLLTKDEIVHHINGIKTDNRIENLQLTNIREHIKIHMKLRGVMK